MSNQQQQQPGGSMDFLWLVVLIAFIALIIWFTAKTEVVRFIILVKIYELKLVGFFHGNFAGLIQQLEYFYAHPQEVTLQQLGQWLFIVGKTFNIVVAVLLPIFAFFLYFTHPATKFSTTFNMQRLLDAEKENWPQITPVSQLKLVEESIDKGPWAMAMTPMQFAKRTNMLIENRVTDENVLATVEKVTVTVDRAMAEKVFTRQLGKLWQSAEKLPIYAQALFAIFAARANRDRADAVKLLQQIARSSQSGKLDFTGTETLRDKYKNAPNIKELEKRHAYELTFMASLLELGRTDGVLSSADFLWLKPLDRSLWYMLNNVGRRTAFPEVAGPYAHWLAEKALNRRLMTPMVNEAIIALENALSEIIYIPDEKQQS